MKKQNNIDDLFRGALRDYGEEPPLKVWKGVKKSLLRKKYPGFILIKPSRIVKTIYLSGIIGVIVVLGAYIINKPNKVNVVVKENTVKNKVKDNQFTKKDITTKKEEKINLNESSVHSDKNKVKGSGKSDKDILIDTMYKEIPPQEIKHIRECTDNKIQNLFHKPTDKQQPGNKKTKIDSSNKLKYDSKLKQLNVSDTTNKSIFK